MQLQFAIKKKELLCGKEKKGSITPDIIETTMNLSVLHSKTSFFSSVICMQNQVPQVPC